MEILKFLIRQELEQIRNVNTIYFVFVYDYVIGDFEIKKY